MAVEPFLITGCARSGTTFITAALKLAGLDVKHEAIGTEGAVSWTMTPNATATPWGPPFEEGKYEHIFHQVRDPLKTIASVIVTEPKASWDFIRKFVPEIDPAESKLMKAVKYWIYWNKMAEAKAEMSYRIEDINTAFVEIGRRIGYPLDPEILKLIPKNTNHRASYDYLYSWEELEELLPESLFFELRELAEHYGYKTMGEK